MVLSSLNRLAHGTQISTMNKIKMIIKVSGLQCADGSIWDVWDVFDLGCDVWRINDNSVLTSPPFEDESSRVVEV